MFFDIWQDSQLLRAFFDERDYQDDVYSLSLKPEAELDMKVILSFSGVSPENLQLCAIDCSSDPTWEKRLARPNKFESDFLIPFIKRVFDYEEGVRSVVMKVECPLHKEELIAVCGVNRLIIQKIAPCCVIICLEQIDLERDNQLREISCLMDSLRGATHALSQADLLQV